MVHISGPHAELRAGYQRAAVLGAWTITPSEDRLNTFVFRATTMEAHPVWIGMPPLDLVVSLGTTQWLWTGVAVEPSGDGLIVQLTTRPRVSQHPRGTV